MSGYFALKLEISSCTVSSLPQPPMGYVHSLMLAPDAEPEAAVEAALEAAVLVEADLPPQAASRPAAPTAPAPLRKLRRVMLRDSKSMFIEIRSSEILFSFFPILNAKNGALRVPKTHKAPGTAPFVF